MDSCTYRRICSTYPHIRMPIAPKRHVSIADPTFIRILFVAIAIFCLLFTTYNLQLFGSFCWIRWYRQCISDNSLGSQLARRPFVPMIYNGYIDWVSQGKWWLASEVHLSLLPDKCRSGLEFEYEARAVKLVNWLHPVEDSLIKNQRNVLCLTLWMCYDSPLQRIHKIGVTFTM